MVRATRVLLAAALLVSFTMPGFSQTLPGQYDGKPLISGMDGVIEKYEKNARIEKYDLQIVLEIKWTDNAGYRTYTGGETTQTIWDLKYDGHGRAVSRLYRTGGQFGQPAKIEVAPARFMLKPRKISLVSYYIDKDGSTTSNGVSQMVPPVESVVAGPGIIQGRTEGVTLDFTLSAGMIAPTVNGAPMTMMTPFMTPINPQKIMDTAKLSKQQFMADPYGAMEGTFKIPISTDFIDFSGLKAKKVVVVRARDSKTGPGILGNPPTTGTQRCSYDATIYLSLTPAGSMLKPGVMAPLTADGDGKRPPESPSAPPAASPAPSKPATPADKDAATLSRGKAPTGNILGSTIFKGISKRQGKFFTGKDYLKLSAADREKLTGNFIQAAADAGITIRNSASYYRQKMDAYYAAHPDQIEDPFVETLMLVIRSENDWV